VKEYSRLEISNVACRGPQPCPLATEASSKSRKSN
jgi:hypothetical protein